MEPNPKKPAVNATQSIGFAGGIIVGIILGAIIGNMAIGLIIGFAIGLGLFGATRSRG